MTKPKPITPDPEEVAPKLGDFVYARPMSSAYTGDNADDVFLCVNDIWQEGYWEAGLWHNTDGSPVKGRVTAWAPLPKVPADSTL